LGYAASYWPRWQSNVAEASPKITAAKVAVKPEIKAEAKPVAQTQPSPVIVTVDSAPALVVSTAPSVDAQGVSVAPTQIVSSPVVITQDAPVQAAPLPVASAPVAPAPSVPNQAATPVPSSPAPVLAAPVATPAQNAATASTSVPASTTAPAPAITESVATMPNPPDDILSRRLTVTEAWLANQAPSTVSIQLMGANSDEQLKGQLEMLSRQIELDNLYVYRTMANNQPFLSVLYGSYADRNEATRALQKLPADLQKNRPHLRTIAGVLQEIK
jgi:SPOR domain